MPECKQCRNAFVIDERDTKFYAQIGVPHPTFCPDCRQQRRLAWTDEIFLYPRTCDRTKKPIISMYRQESPCTVYSMPEWWGDDWEGLEYGRAYDPGRSVMTQILELNRAVPHPALNVDYPTVINCEYVNHCGHLKNCYLIFDSDGCEECYYSGTITECRDSSDCLKSKKCELCYECIDCYECFHLLYSQDCLKCSESWFLRDCFNCTNCFACSHLRNKSYCFLNEQLTPEAYNERLASLNLSDRTVVRDWHHQVQRLSLAQPHKFLHGFKNSGCSGDYLYNTNETGDAFDCRETENCRYCYSILFPTKDLYDIFQWGNNSQLLYESVVVGDGDYNCRFCIRVYPNCQNMEYCIDCFSCKNCFGCIGLKKKEFCIFNTQYNEEEYHALREKIINQMTADGEYGEFFPAAESPHGYNETDAILYFPLNKREATEQGFTWYDSEERQTIGAPPPARRLEDDSVIISTPYRCQCGRLFKIIPQELSLYKKLGTPLPEFCYICRHHNRLALRNPQKLHHRACMRPGCTNEFETTYSPDRPETVYCEECYQKAIY